MTVWRIYTEYYYLKNINNLFLLYAMSNDLKTLQKDVYLKYYLQSESVKKFRKCWKDWKSSKVNNVTYKSVQTKVGNKIILIK